jgi:hypothetical protein
MKYWIKNIGTSEFHGPFSISEIKEQIRSGAINWDFEAVEASGQSLGALKRTTSWIPLGSLFTEQDKHSSISQNSLDSAASSKAFSIGGGQSPSAFLEMVRGRTCYTALREMIGLLSTISIVVTTLLAGALVVVGLRDNSAGSIVAGIAIGVLGCFAAIAAKQASLLLIDIADTLIEQVRTKESDRS